MVDQQRFDELAKGLATNRLSRRHALRMLGSALVGGALASVPGMAWAKPKPGKGKCKNPGDCPIGQDCCNGSCTPIGTPDNCFGCGALCNDPGVACCQDVPGSNFSFTCRSLNDIKHCGACNNACSGADAACCNQVCRNTDSDPINCSCCDCPCPRTQICQGGLCVCPEGLTLCGDICRNVQTDVDNCGSCGNVCSGGETCQEGVCACPPGQTKCQGVCRNLQTDPNNCGVCATVCHQSQVCTSGRCQCPNGTVAEFCSCTDPGLNCPPNFKCCQKLDGSAVCQATCAVACPPGTTCCECPCPHPPLCASPGFPCPPCPPGQ
jgi:hypothetical protein